MKNIFFVMMLLLSTSYLSASEISYSQDNSTISANDADLVEVVLKVPANTLFIHEGNIFVNYDGFVLPVKSPKKFNSRFEYLGVCEYGHLIICKYCGGCGVKRCEYSCACDPRVH